jgi:hypothetical protein
MNACSRRTVKYHKWREREGNVGGGDLQSCSHVAFEVITIPIGMAIADSMIISASETSQSGIVKYTSTPSLATYRLLSAHNKKMSSDSR